jgi:hypothetical protein
MVLKTWREIDVPALEMNEARETLELKVRECLIQMWGQLRDRIDPNPKILEIIHTLFLQMAMREDPKFKLERFDFLHTALVKVVADQLNKIIVSFDKWFQDFISHLNEKPLLKPSYHSPGAVRCTLYWSNQSELLSYPDLMLENFYRCVKENWPEKLTSPLQFDYVGGLKENCKATRLSYFEEVKKANHVKAAVEVFACKILKEMLKEEGKGEKEKIERD